MTLPDHWDPEKDARVYYRRTCRDGSGERGWKVRRNGRDMIRLDLPERGNPMEEEAAIRPFNPAEWSIEKDFRPLTRLQVAHIAFEMDKRLCLYLGLHDAARKEWISLKDEQRIAWRDKGPRNPKIRAIMWKKVMKARELEALSSE